MRKRGGEFDLQIGGDVDQEAHHARQRHNHYIRQFEINTRMRLNTSTSTGVLRIKSECE